MAVPSLLDPALAAVTPSLVNAHRRFLSDGLLAGATPATRGAEIAVRYAAAQFEGLGLKAGASGGSYLQSVPLLGITAEPSLILGAGRQTIALNTPSEFLAWPEAADTALSIDGDLVFAGYGIEAPEWTWDDYKGMPQTGKIVLVLAGDPGERDSTVYRGRRHARNANPASKLAQASRMGAVGVLFIHTDESAHIPWSELRDDLSHETLRIDSGKAASRALKFAGWVREDVVRRVLQAAGRDYELLVRRAQQREFSPITAGIHVAVDIRSRIRRLKGTNAVALLEGTRPGETIMLSAAQDDPGGTASLLAAAAGLSRFSSPTRSVLFVSAAGRIGQQYAVSAVPAGSRVDAAVILTGQPGSDTATSLTVKGGRLSTLAESLGGAAQEEGMTLKNDSTPAVFAASAAFPLALAGIPPLEVSRCASDRCARTLVRFLWQLNSLPNPPAWLAGSPFAPDSGRAQPR